MVLACKIYFYYFNKTVLGTKLCVSADILWSHAIDSDKLSKSAFAKDKCGLESGVNFSFLMSPKRQNKQKQTPTFTLVSHCILE